MPRDHWFGTRIRSSWVNENCKGKENGNIRIKRLIPLTSEQYHQTGFPTWESEEFESSGPLRTSSELKKAEMGVVLTDRMNSEWELWIVGEIKKRVHMRIPVIADPTALTKTHSLLYGSTELSQDKNQVKQQMKKSPTKGFA